MEYIAPPGEPARQVNARLPERMPDGDYDLVLAVGTAEAAAIVKICAS